MTDYSGKKPNVLMVVFSHYPFDARVRREAEAMQDNDIQVDVLCLRAKGEKAVDSHNHVNIYRIRLDQKRGGKLRYLWEYSYFILSAFFKVMTLYFKNRYDIVHVHNMPDILVISALIPKIFGAKIILDIHDPMPELYVTKFNIPESHIVIKTLKFLEKFSINFAHLVFTPNISFRNLFIARGCSPEKIHIIMNSPQEDIFKKRVIQIAPYPEKEAFNIMYHGIIVERHGLDIAVEAIAMVKKHIPNIKLHIYHEGTFLNVVLDKVRKLGVTDKVKYHGLVTAEQIAKAIQQIDLGVIPNKMNPFTNINFPTRIFEYLSQGKPVLASETKGICDYFKNGSIHFFEPNNAESLAEKIKYIYNNWKETEEITYRGVQVYEKYTWEKQKQNLLILIAQLLNKRRRSVKEMERNTVVS